MKHISIAVAGILIFSMVGAYSATRYRPLAAIAMETSFRDAWDEDAARIAVAVVVPPLPRPRPPTPVAVEEPPLPEIITEGFSEERVRRITHRHHRAGDLCTRHHLRKVHYGRTWRCR